MSREWTKLEVQDQLLFVLIRDLGYTKRPLHGHDPLRHQFAWEMAVEGREFKDIEKKIAQTVDNAAADGEEIPKREW